MQLRKLIHFFPVVQCDQMARLFFKICHFLQRKSADYHKNVAKVDLKLCQILN